MKTLTKKEAEKLTTLISKLEAFQQCMSDPKDQLGDAKRLLMQFETDRFNIDQPASAITGNSLNR
jgi:hypothetical protein